jgi:hypothetical protein
LPNIARILYRHQHHINKEHPMPQTRRRFITTSSAAVGMTVILSFAARAASHSQDEFTTSAGNITVHPVSHASFVMETPAVCNLL